MSKKKVIEWLLKVILTVTIVAGFWWFSTKPSIFTLEPVLDIGRGEPLPRSSVFVIAVVGVGLMLASPFITRWLINRMASKLKRR